MISSQRTIVAGAGCILFLCWVVISEKPLSALRKLNFFMDRKFEAVFVKIDKFRSASSFYQKKPGVLALAFVNSRPFLTSNIIGATAMEQLKTNIASINLVLTKDLLKAIENIHSSQPNPCP